MSHYRSKQHGQNIKNGHAVGGWRHEKGKAYEVNTQWTQEIYVRMPSFHLIKVVEKNMSILIQEHSNVLLSDSCWM